MEKVTHEMSRIARKTKTETVSMKIITLVTLFFLPGTFIAVSCLLLLCLVSSLRCTPSLHAPSVMFAEDARLDLVYQRPLLMRTSDTHEHRYNQLE